VPAAAPAGTPKTALAVVRAAYARLTVTTYAKAISVRPQAATPIAELVFWGQ